MTKLKMEMLDDMAHKTRLRHAIGLPNERQLGYVKTIHVRDPEEHMKWVQLMLGGWVRRRQASLHRLMAAEFEIAPAAIEHLLQPGESMASQNFSPDGDLMEVPKSEPHLTAVAP